MVTFPFPLSEDIYQRISPWDVEGVVSIPSAVSQDWTTIVSFTVANINRGFMLAYGYDVNDPLYDFFGGSILFRITYADAPIPNYGNFQLQHGTIAAPKPIMLYADPGIKLALQARRAVASSQANNVGAVISGVIWPQKFCLPFNDPPVRALAKPHA